MSDELARAGGLLRAAHKSLAEALTAAGTAVRAAHAEGISEVQIAKQVGVTRNTVRSWLGKPRKR